ncbi:hypothetical protein [Clostridium paraputrificum]|uniref:Uncharacterized protein n=3 Tax=Clostridium paraputrificum TaxID=29363 RepID=A0A1B8RSQ1_9CLOT|nr:hypothetical protein [Clostridium paraputrificum]OBY11858.1 hypothetical protein CP373A1_02735 [Clostridium paraputrificum]
MEIREFDFLAEEVPGAASEIREALDLLYSSIDSALDEVGDKIFKETKKRNFSRIKDLSVKCESVSKLNSSIQEAINYLDGLIEVKEDEEEKARKDEFIERSITNYKDYEVDNEIEHNLYEDLTFKRPCAIKIDGKKFEVKDWKKALITTLEYLSIKDINLIKGFPDDPKMNGKKVIYFSRVELPNMRSVQLIKGADIYITTNLSANSIRNLIIKCLKKYNMKISDFKIYFRADYSDLH